MNGPSEEEGRERGERAIKTTLASGDERWVDGRWRGVGERVAAPGFGPLTVGGPTDLSGYEALSMYIHIDAPRVPPEVHRFADVALTIEIGSPLIAEFCDFAAVPPDAQAMIDSDERMARRAAELWPNAATGDAP